MPGNPSRAGGPAPAPTGPTGGPAVRGRLPGHLPYRWRDGLVAAAFLLPNLVLLAVFTYRPLADNIRLSFTSWNISSPTATWIGWDNYVEWFTSAGSRTVVWNTVVFTGAAVVGSIVLGLALALLLDQKLVGRDAVRSLVFAPFVLAGAAVGVAFQFVFDPTFGLVQDLLRRVGAEPPAFYQDPSWALFMVTVTYVWKNLGYTFVIYLAALQGRRRDLDEAAEIDAASTWTAFRRVTWPQLRPATFFLLITVLLNSFQVFDVIHTMTRGGPLGDGTTTMVYQVYQETFVNLRAGYGATVATIMFLALLLITAVQVLVMRRGEER
ncbi:glycerol-3-phosphate ABC transporter permease [Cellulomonas carbonis T26]|uniref:Glycerol-3-phosphate ABC transporter permease n=1 Tax=Cellulomonas carbonis T26 TaxID=947969 RepID=A0A0A0BSM4_9CELL|nr:glycerol-3-phosphate ABC transporter permease [Cellulomonas carbonis T26]